MRRSRWSRALGALMGIWVPLLIAEPAALHICPMHSAHGGAPHAAATAAARPAASAHGAHGHVTASVDTPDDTKAPAPHGSSCCCPGPCDGVVLAALASAAAPRLPLAPAAVVAVPRDALAQRAHPVDVVLPYPNGPPSLG